MGDSNGASKLPGVQQRPVSRSIIVAARLLLLLLAAGSVVAAIMMTAGDRARDDASARYVCPMHPEVRAAEPGECPICRMALVPVSRTRAATATTLREATAMADVAAVENIRKHNVIDFVRKRSLLFAERELRGPASVEDDGTITAVFYRDQIDALGADEQGTFSLAQTPKITFPVRRTADPAVRWDGSTSRLRFALDPGRSAKVATLRPGQVGWLELAPRPRSVLTVPAAALLQSPEGPYVLVSAGGYRFEKRFVEIGETFLKEGFAVVLSGVALNERVVARAAFFFDADRRLGQAGVSMSCVRSRQWKASAPSPMPFPAWERVGVRAARRLVPRFSEGEVGWITP